MFSHSTTQQIFPEQLLYARIKLWTEHKHLILCFSSLHLDVREFPPCPPEACILPRDLRLLEKVKKKKNKKLQTVGDWRIKGFSHPAQWIVTLRESVPRICFPELRNILWLKLMTFFGWSNKDSIEHIGWKFEVPLNRCWSYFLSSSLVRRLVN